MDDKMDLAGESKMGFARKLASPKKKTREKAVSLLVLWLTSQKQLDENELKRIWKGLFYCVWHSDKAAVQADLIERLASILEKLDITLALQFFKVFLVTMRREWAGIDRLRLDKFYLLLRKCLAYMLSALQKTVWHTDYTKEFMDIFVKKAFLATDQYAALGVNLHYAEIFLQELKNFLPLQVETFKLLLEPFLVVCARTSDKSLLQRINENLFEHLFRLGRIVITAKRDGNPLDSTEEVLGSLLLSWPLGSEAFKLASLPSTLQASRKTLYELHSEYEKLEKLRNSSGITILLETVASKKGKRKKKTGLGPIRSIEKSKKKKAHPEQTVNTSKVKSMSALDEGIVASVSLDRRKSTRTSSLKRMDVSEEGNTFSENKEGEGMSENTKCIVPGKKEQETTGHEEKKKKKESSGKRKKVALIEASEEGPPIISNGLGTDDSVVSKLEKQFDLLADESLAKSDISLSPSVKVSKTISPLDAGSRKRKRRISTDGVDKGHEAIEHPVSVAGYDTTPSTAVKVGNSSGKVKRVRFALKKNLVWTPSTPLPAESIRVPPSATPRGSALKKGVPPGPIVIETANTLRNRKGTPMRAYKNKKSVLKHVKLLLEKELGKGIKGAFGESGKLLLGGLE